MPKSFLVKKASRGKRREDTEQESEESCDDKVDGEGETNVAGTDDVAIQCNLQTSLDGPAAHARSFGGNEPVYHHRYDTHNLHTLAELCLKRADFEYAQLQDSSNFGSERTKSMVDVGSACTLQSRQETKDTGQNIDITLERNFVKREEDSEPELRTITTYDKKRSQVNTAQSKKEPRSRIDKVEEELEKMLQGKEEIISREIKEFLDNNKLIQKNAVRETGVTQTEMSKFLLEGVHLKDDKRQTFYRWYLENKLNNMDPDDESFTCYKCGKIFAYESYLERHVKYVCPDKTGRTWKCSYCSKAFQYPCYLRRHMRSHTGESPYKCTQCSRAFVRSTDLQRHLRNHTGEKPYKCKECSRAFARSTDLKRHMRTHTGEKPYKCWQCSKAFSQSGSLQTHLHTHYKESLQLKGSMSDKSKISRT